MITKAFNLSHFHFLCISEVSIFCINKGGGGYRKGLIRNGGGGVVDRNRTKCFPIFEGWLLYEESLLDYCLYTEETSSHRCTVTQ